MHVNRVRITWAVALIDRLVDTFKRWREARAQKEVSNGTTRANPLSQTKQAKPKRK